ncbi:MAG: hypothetical protein KC535_03615, partial [Nanoarchaeota archaeon]|nr:hypothetical protein [Nanoarchaeota archaeon]
MARKIELVEKSQIPLVESNPYQQMTIYHGILLPYHEGHCQINQKEDVWIEDSILEEKIDEHNKNSEIVQLTYDFFEPEKYHQDDYAGVGIIGGKKEIRNYAGHVDRFGFVAPEEIASLLINSKEYL